MANWKKIIMIVIVGVSMVVFLGGIAKVSAQTLGPGLRTKNNLLVYPDGTRFIVKGANVEAFRDYVGGCGYVSDDLFTNSNGVTPQLGPMVTKMKSLGINAVRLNYDWRYVNNGNYQNLSKFLDVAQALANAGIFVMPSDHYITGENMSSQTDAFPTMKAIIDGFRARGIEYYLIMNPFNEPANLEWPAWTTKNKEILAYLRNTANYKGLVMLDAIEWASENDAASYQSIIAYDASLLGGQSNVGFENHWYPNIDNGSVGPTTEFGKSLEFAKTYPIAIGELGQYNGTPDTPSYVSNLLTSMVNTGISNGHNGVFAWIWSWCDSNKMTDPWDDYTKLTSYGQLYVDYYYNKVSSTVPTIKPSVSPTPTSATSRPGDANGDGKVDDLDYIVWAKYYGLTNATGASQGDFNADKKVDDLDYVIWAKNYS